MANPPGWVYQTKLYASNRELYGNVATGVGVGVVGAAEINSQPSRTGGASLSQPAAWSTIWFIVATLYLLGVYYGMIKLRSNG